MKNVVLFNVIKDTNADDITVFHIDKFVMVIGIAEKGKMNLIFIIVDILEIATICLLSVTDLRFVFTEEIHVKTM